ncbi:MAG: PAS domain-containing protein, partial [Syntrophales bacterium]
MRDENIARGHLIRKLQKLNERIVELKSTEAELKQVQEVLQKERETFFPILHKAPYGIALIDDDGRFIYINPAFTYITGYTLEDIFAARGWFHRASPFSEYRREIISSLKRDVIQKGVDKIFNVVCKNGETKEIEFKPTLLDDGRVVVILSDITERKRTEDALRESEEKYRTILENIEDGYFEVDIAGNLIFFNDSLCRMLGYSKDEMIG